MATNGAQNIATGASGTILRGAGVGSAPTFSTSTYPATNAINTILYASSANVMSALATANNGVLLTNGSGVPSIGTATVTVGGTGNSSFSAYDVVCGGTTTTGALQQVSGEGSSGQVLTSNGASALPTWQAAAGAFAPNATVTLYEDFLGQILTGQVYGTFFGTTTTLSTNNWGNQGPTVENGHPGVISNYLIDNVHTASVQFGEGAPTSGTSGITFSLGGGASVMNVVFKINTLSTSTSRYLFSFGYGVPSDSNNIIFSYQDNLNSGDWQLICTNSGTATTTNTSTAVTTGWHNAQISINAAGTSVQFFMDGVSLGTISTHIPTGPALNAPQFVIKGVTGAVTACAANSFYLDLWYYSLTLTTAR